MRTLLREEVGVEPGPALRDLERRLLDHDPGLLLRDTSVHAASSRATGSLVRGFRTYPAARQAS